MEYLGIDVHKVESQICILTESGEIIERRIPTERERFAAVLGEGPRAKIPIEASTESEWVARCLGRAGPRGGGGGSEFRRHVRDPEPQGEDRPARRAHAGRSLQAGRVSPSAPDLEPITHHGRRPG